MPDVNWQPDGDVERDLSTYRQRRDNEAFLRRLARADLLLPLLPGQQASGAGTVSWLASQISGQRCVVAFTSVSAMRQLMGGEPPYRSARFIELAATWPDASVQLAVDPGLPIEVFLSPAVVVELAGVAAQPATELEQTLARALADEDPETYAMALLVTDVLVPIEPTGSDSRDITDPEFSWWRLTGEDAAIVVFTSPDRLREQLGDSDQVEVPFGALVTAWPDPAAGLAVDPGTVHGGVFAAEVMTQLREELTRRGRIAAEVLREVQGRVDLTEPQRLHLAQQLLDERLDAPVAPVPADTPGARVPVSSPDGAETTVQVVVLPAQVERYLRHGHLRVAGLIHRRPARALPLAELYTWLGLLGDGSPFSATDPLGYVLRWADPDPEAFRSPTMDGLEVPTGASLWQIDSSGREYRLAMLREGRWVSAS